MSIILDVATQFDPYPFGRYDNHGPKNGTRFREDLLLPLLKRGEHVTVDLTNARGLAASFLEESFGGLVRAGLSADFIASHVVIRSETDPSLIIEVQSYIHDAVTRARMVQH